MSLDPSNGRRSVSPSSSAGRSSPITRPPRRAEDGNSKKDKTYRRYAAGIERALATFDSAQQEWADYIAFLARLLKAIQAPPPSFDTLPDAPTVALRLAQCLNPALPSGVHQKALEVYTCIFALIGKDALARDLPIYLPGLSPTLSFASLTVRPLFYTVVEDHILHLERYDLRRAVKTLILSLLPGIEDETSEDFERALSILDKLRRVSGGGGTEGLYQGFEDGYFWQCFFLAVITGTSRRQGALAYLTRRLPNFTPPKHSPSAKDNGNGTETEGQVTALSPAAQAVVSPEPGLLIRCFAAGLLDGQMLVQRGFLDLLVTHLPLNSPILRETIDRPDLERLVSAAVGVVLRRDMSLNRRLWSWFLGPDMASDAREGSQPNSPVDEKKDLAQNAISSQVTYFQRYGAAPLRKSIFTLLRQENTNAVDRARPFRICLSLMDRWEVGGSIIPDLLFPALDSAFRYSLTGSENEISEVIRSASLFFDGVESDLIWTRLIEIIVSIFDEIESKPVDALHNLAFLKFIIGRFNVREEDMLLQHMPNAALVIASRLAVDSRPWTPQNQSFFASMLNIVSELVRMIPGRAFSASKRAESTPTAGSLRASEGYTAAAELVLAYYSHEDVDDLAKRQALDPWLRGEYLTGKLTEALVRALHSNAHLSHIDTLAGLVTTLLAKVGSCQIVRDLDIYKSFETALSPDSSAAHATEPVNFSVMSSLMTIILHARIGDETTTVLNPDQVKNLEPALMSQLWSYLSPFQPKHHVETARLIWQLEALTTDDKRVEAQLAEFVCEGCQKQDHETAGRFAILWDYTMQASTARSDKGGRMLTRRVSTMSVMSDLGNNVDPERVLIRPLLLLLDCLQDGYGEATVFVRTWLQNVSSLDRIIGILLSRLQSNFGDYKRGLKRNVTRRQTHRDREIDQDIRDIAFSFQHLHNVLRHSTPNAWDMLASLEDSTGGDAFGQSNGFLAVAEMCIEALNIRTTSDNTRLHHLALSLLRLLMDSPNRNALKPLELETTLINQLQNNLSTGPGSIQTTFLNCILQALRIRLAVDAAPPPMSSKIPASPNPSASTERIEPAQLQKISSPPTQLLDCLRSGFSSPHCRLFLQYWVDFLADILPLYADAIFANMIPLVECLCDQTTAAFQFLKTNNETGAPHESIPNSTLPALLHGMELLLAHAHQRLQVEDVSSPVMKSPQQPQGFFGNMVSGVFTAEGPPSKTSRTNSKLTLILCFQDAIRTCFSIWAWASHGTESSHSDPTSAASISLIGLKLRNRTRKILEHLFAAEPLETLETLAVAWLRQQSVAVHAEPSVVFSLLHVLEGSRPRNTVPVIFNALYSRTNLDALEMGRRSSLTCDLTGGDVVAFLVAYTRTVEDDATDEIWADCIYFLRDVLANPLPHRQILPALLEFTVLLAEKIDNTNFGELRKMRRELGDIFLRLLTATFTTRSQGSLADGSSTANGAPDLLSSLNSIAPKLQLVLESTDRVLNAVNTISTNAVNPAFHSKSFPENVTEGHLRLLQEIAQQSPAAKTWRKDMTDAFNNPRILASPVSVMENSWFPALRRWVLSDKDRMPELVSRITAPSTAGIMFGVGANAARLEADRKTQMHLRRIAILLLANEQDAFLNSLSLISEKLVELCTADVSSSPSSVTRAEVFMVMRALLLSFDGVHLSALWPVINANLHAAIASMLPNSTDQARYTNLALLQACKLLDLLVALAPDEFQLHEWLYITDTIDAVYRPAEWAPSALIDEVAEVLGAESSSFDQQPVYATPTTPTAEHHASGVRRTLLRVQDVDSPDMKAMAKEDFVRSILQPFFNQLSMFAYEATYGMGVPDLEACMRGLLGDLVDEGTIA